MADLTLTLGELAQAVPGLQAIGAKGMSSIRAAFAIAKIKRVGNEELKDLETARTALCEQYAVRGEDGKPARAENGGYDIGDRVAFDAGWRAILEEPVTLPGCRAIRLSELEGVPLSPDELFSLWPLVVEGDPETNGSKPQLVQDRPEPAAQK